jgi:hypothetical protein
MNLPPQMCPCDGFILLQIPDIIILSNPPIRSPTLAGMMTSELSSQACSLGPLYESKGVRQPSGQF